MIKILLRTFAKVFSVEMKSEVLLRQSLVKRLIQHRESRGSMKETPGSVWQLDLENRATTE